MYIYEKTDQGRCSELDGESAKIGYRIRKPDLLYYEKHLRVHCELYTMFIEFPKSATAL